MTDFKKAFREINQKKIKYMISILEIEALVILIEALSLKLNIHFFGLGVDGLYANSVVSLANYIFIWMIFVNQEKFWTQNRFRLLPLKTSKLALANFSGTYLIWLLFIGGQATLYGLSTLAGLNKIFDFNLQGTDLFAVIGLTVAVILGLTLFITVIVSFIDLLGKTVLSKSPVKVGKVLIVILYLAVTVALVLGFNYSIFTINEMFIKANGAGPLSTSLFVGMVILSITLMWSGVVLMLNRYIETKK